MTAKELVRYSARSGRAVVARYTMEVEGQLRELGRCERRVNPADGTLICWGTANNGPWCVQLYRVWGRQ